MKTVITKQPGIIDLPKIIDRRGNLSIIEENNHIPFKIVRTYWVYDVPGENAGAGMPFIRTRNSL